MMMTMTMMEKITRGVSVPRQDATTKAWVDYCNALGMKVNGKTLERAQIDLLRHALLAEHKPGTPGRNRVEANMRTLLDKRFESWVKQEEETNPVLKAGIEYHKLLASLKKKA